MKYFQINGRRPLGGCISVGGAKNAVLPILAASLLVEGESVIHNVPRLSDVACTVNILRHLGASVRWEGHTLVICADAVHSYDIPAALMHEMRSSIIFMGALCSKMKKACLYLPGGCEIGLRPIDLHIKALRALGYVLTPEGETICCEGSGAKANDIVLTYPSVGATENILLASVLLDGTTKIVNAAREPEIVDLCRFLNAAGADIHGAGTTVIVINGVKRLHTAEHTVIPDRIIAATYLSLAAASHSTLHIRGIVPTHIQPMLAPLMEAGCQLYFDKSAVTLRPPKRLKRVRSIVTQPHPGFPTDAQAPFCTMLSLTNGASVVYETVFENRFRHVPALNRFGTDITVHDRVAVINGVKSLHAATASCTDLRGGAAIVIAALVAEGTSVIKEIHHIDRGYECLENQLTAIGAEITRIHNEKEEQNISEKNEYEACQRGRPAQQ